MIKLYEVKFDLDNGQTLSMLVAGGSAGEAKGAAHSILIAASEPRGIGDAIKFNWRWDEITASEVIISEVIRSSDEIHEMHMNTFGA